MTDERPETGSHPPEKRYPGVILLCALVAGIVLAIDLSIPLGVAGGVPYIVAVLISLWYPRRRFTVLVAVVSTLLTAIGFFLSPPGGEIWKVITNRTLAVFAIWVTAILSIQRKTAELKREIALVEREKAVKEVKILSGMIPICASCKKVRDDKGYWQQIEHYIEQNSEIDLSHGLCPECTKELYPDVYEKMQAKKRKD